MHRDPFFTVIVPVFNREKLIQQTLNSLLNQTFVDFEVLAIDDYSSDQSIDNIKALLKNDNRIKLVKHEENKGRSAARNTGLSHAKGKWICYLDSDDIYENNHLESFYQLILENPNYSCFAQKSGILGEDKKYNNSIESIKIKFSDILKKNLFVPNQICHSKEISVKWFEEISYSEDLLFVREILINHTILYNNKITSRLRIHEERSMNRVSNDKFIKDNTDAINYLFTSYSKIEPRHKKIIESSTYLICLNLNYEQGYIKNNYLMKKVLFNMNTYCNLLFYLFIFKILFFYPFKQLLMFNKRSN